MEQESTPVALQEIFVELPDKTDVELAFKFKVIVGGIYVQDWVVTGVPPVQPLGEEVKTVLVCNPPDEQVPQDEYVQEVQVSGITDTVK
jgi:hypothetical protein